MKLLTKITLAAVLLIAGFGIRAEPESTSEQSTVAHVASTRSQVFHKPDCQWARKIAPESRRIFEIREYAIKASERPCKVCTP